MKNKGHPGCPWCEFVGGAPRTIPQKWYPLAWWRWIKRLRGLRWERWVIDRDKIGDFPGDFGGFKEYATEAQYAKDFLRETFDDVGGKTEGIRNERRTGSYVVGFPS